MLCEVCRRCFEGMHDPALTPRIRLKDSTSEFYKENTKEIEKYVYGHHPTRLSLEASGMDARGCLLCVDICRDMALPDEVDESNFFSTFVASYHSDKTIEVQINIGDAVYKEWLVLARDDSTIEFDNSTDGPLARRQVAQWLQHCTDHHERCRLDRTHTFLPTRLLQVDSANDSPTYRLALRSDCPSDTRYVALSYVWGTDPIQNKLRLLRSTYEYLCREKSIDTLPKTFRNTIQVALRLGIQHVWIDSLCIFQDSEEDWKAEAATMQDVYRNSSTTISAIGGANDRAGLFYRRESTKLAPTVIKIKPSAKENYSTFIHPDERDPFTDTARFFLDNVLVARAWCFQERLLSPRVLHFGAQQIYWECRENTASECHPEDTLSRSRLHSNRDYPVLWKPLISHSDPSVADDLWGRVFCEWYHSLYMYSRCQLTVSSDKLIAISGLANDMRRVLRDNWPEREHRYLAGLWEEELPTSLLWQAIDPGKRSLVYRAPTWSWASIDAAVQTETKTNDKVDRQWFVSNQDCTAYTECLGPSDTGGVSGGYLELIGPYAIVELRGSKAQLSCEPLDDHFKDETSGVQLATSTTARRVRDLHVAFDTEDDVPEQALLIPIIAGKLGSINAEYYMEGLVLVRVKDTERYQRIGLCVGFMGKGEVDRLSENLERRAVIVI